MRLSKADWFWVVTRIAVGAIFAYAGWVKLYEPRGNFEATLLRYGVFSPQWIPWIALILPWAEWLLGFLLIVGYAPRLTAGGLAGLSLVFLATLASSQILLEPGGSDCGCFGQSGLHLSMRQIFVVDLVSLTVALRWLFARRFPLTLHGLLLKKG